MNTSAIVIIACILCGFVWDFCAEFYYDEKRELNKMGAWTLFAIGLAVGIYHTWCADKMVLFWVVIAYEALCLFTIYHFYQDYKRECG